MAAADESINPPHPPPPAPTLPQYPEMILAAIEALNEKDGSNKSAITNFIESTYGELPAAHSTLLSHHLDTMKQSGELIMLKNNYMKPDPNAPPKRGRGRPPKPKGPVPEGISVGPPRPRGRPPKPRDPFAPPPQSKPKKVSPGSGKPRGRPPKKAKVEASATASIPAATAAAVPAAGAPRGRGRPPKVKTTVAAVGA